MKNKFILLLTSIFIVGLSPSKSTVLADATQTVVYTPCGSPIAVECNKPFPNFNAEQSVNDYLSLFPNIEFLEYGTEHANCHSYSFYSQNLTTNNYWIEDPSDYYTDGSYIEVLVPQQNDIICYFDTNESPSITNHINIHSGIIQSVLNESATDIFHISNLIICSKWGESALFRHRGNECIYLNAGYNVDTIKFFRLATLHQVHNYGSYDYKYINSSTHEAYCVCGAYQIQSHNFSDSGTCIECATANHNYVYTFLNNLQHKINCTHCNEIKYQGHVFLPSDLQFCILCKSSVKPGTIGEIIMPSRSNICYISTNGSYIMNNGYMVLMPEDLNSFLNNTLNFYPINQNNNTI